MDALRDVVARMIELRQEGKAQLTLLAVCPNSATVLEAAVRVAAECDAPMLFAATLNQVDRDGGYTGWTPASFCEQLGAFAARYGCRQALYPCLDHGGAWLKDRHALDHLSLAETMSEVKQSLTDCLVAGYQLLHVDATVDRTLPVGQPVPIEVVVERTVELIEHAESARRRLGLPPVAYEAGSEEVHGGLVEPRAFIAFIRRLRTALHARGLDDAWPCFVVGQVGTDLHTTNFDPSAAERLLEVLSPLGSLPKGHYTDWVSNPEAYPQHGMGGANVGPEFTAEEYLALAELASREKDLLRACPSGRAPGILEALEGAVLESRRWQKWLQPQETGVPFSSLPPERRAWLVQTGARYVWNDAAVQAARQRLYENVAGVMSDPHQFVVDRVCRAMQRYVTSFRLFGAQTLLSVVGGTQ